MSASTTSFQLVKLWTALEETQQRINNEIVPLSTHLGIEDPELMMSLEALSGCIAAHFETFRLQAVPVRTEERR